MLSLPDIETLLVPDESARQRQRMNPDDDVPRAFNDHGKSEADGWFHTTYVDDPSLVVDFYDIYGEFRDRFEESNVSIYDLLLDHFRSRRLIVDGREGEPKVRARKRSAIEADTTYSCDSVPVDWLIEGILPRGSVAMVVGAPYEGKTWVAMSLEKAIAHREPWMGRAFCPSGFADGSHPRCLHLDYEMGPAAVTSRLEILGEFPGPKTETIIHNGVPIETFPQRRGRVLVASHPGVDLDRDEFWASLDTIKPDLVTVDTLSAANPSVDEKDSRFAKPLQRAAAYAKKHGTTFVFVHHSPKCTGSESLLEIIRGSSAIAAALDVAFFVKKVTRFATKDPKERRAVIICKKMRRGGDEPAPFTVRLTDERGLELCDERAGRRASKGAPQSDEDVLLEAIKATPGIGGKRKLMAATGLSEERCVLARARLIDAQKIENRGTAARPELFATAV